MFLLGWLSIGRSLKVSMWLALLCGASLMSWRVVCLRVHLLGVCGYYEG